MRPVFRASQRHLEVRAGAGSQNADWLTVLTPTFASSARHSRRARFPHLYTRGLTIRAACFAPDRDGSGVAENPTGFSKTRSKTIGDDAVLVVPVKSASAERRQSVRVCSSTEVPFWRQPAWSPGVRSARFAAGVWVRSAAEGYR